MLEELESASSSDCSCSMIEVGGYFKIVWEWSSVDVNWHSTIEGNEIMSTFTSGGSGPHYEHLLGIHLNLLYLCSYLCCIHLLQTS